MIAHSSINQPIAAFHAPFPHHVAPMHATLDCFCAHNINVQHHLIRAPSIPNVVQALEFLKGRMTGEELLKCYAQADPGQPLTEDQTSKIFEQLKHYYAHVVAYNQKLKEV
jgi:hypothetical protein